MKQKCIICKEIIPKPKILQLVCKEKYCKRRNKYFLKERWELKNIDYVRERRRIYMKEYNKRNYLKRKKMSLKSRKSIKTIKPD